MGVVAGSRLVGLPVVSLEDASITGRVGLVVLADGAPRVAGLLVDVGLYEAKRLRYADLHGVGPDAVIVKRRSDATPLSGDPDFEALVARSIDLIGSRAVSLTGNPAGTVDDYYLDAATGVILGLRVAGAGEPDSEASSLVLPLRTVRRVGDLTVLEDGFALKAVDDPSFLAVPQTEAEPGPATAVEPAPAVEPKLEPPTLADQPEPEPSPATAAAPAASPPERPAAAFAPHFLLGKTVLKRVTAPSGEVIAEEGHEVTVEMIQRARAADLLLVLSLNAD